MNMYDKPATFVVRYGELSTKGHNRNDFIKRLRENIKLHLRGIENLKIRSTYNRIYIEVQVQAIEEVSQRLTTIFGITSFSIGYPCAVDMEELQSLALEVALKAGYKTFKVDTKRRNKKFGTSSDHVNRQIAGHILRNSDYKVDVRNPELRVKVEIDDDIAYIMGNEIEGAKGLPVGIAGRGILLLSGGIDSPVAAMMMMKRGVLLEGIHFQASPYTSENALHKVRDLCQILTKYQPTFRLNIVNFTPIQLAIYDKVDESYAITMMRRYMVRIAEKLAQKEKALVLVSGESLGQVASQTLESIDVINRAVEIPILRPVIGLDKNEIIHLSKTMGTYETSILPFEDCCTIFTPKAPTTRPKLNRVLRHEQFLDLGEAEETALNELVVEYIDATSQRFY